MTRAMLRAGWVVGSAAWLLLCLPLPAGAQERREPARRGPTTRPAVAARGESDTASATPAPPTHSLRFEATVFQVAMPREKTIELDARKLATNGPTPAKLAESLKAFGKPAALCRVDQLLVAGRSARIQVSTDVPYVTGTQTTSAGQKSTSIARYSAGATFNVASNVPDGAEAQFGQAQVEVEIGTMTDRTIRGDDETVAPIFWRVSQTCSCAQSGRPVVLLSAGPATASTEDAMAYVTLLSLSLVPEAP